MSERYLFIQIPISVGNMLRITKEKPGLLTQEETDLLIQHLNMLPKQEPIQRRDEPDGESES